MALIAVAPTSGRLEDYVVSVRNAGGNVWVLDRTQHVPADVVDRADGILLVGGNDVEPRLYGARAHPTFTADEPGRDEYELEILRLALAANRPVLAICRGMQVLNVLRGGTLTQHIPDDIPGAVTHDVRDSPITIAHRVTIARGSLLDTLLRGTPLRDHDSCAVNSRHHQAPSLVGTGLVVSAIAPDGVVEGIEDQARRFCLGVEWHPESFWRTGEFQPLFDGFVSASHAMGGRRPTP